VSTCFVCGILNACSDCRGTRMFGPNSGALCWLCDGKGVSHTHPRWLRKMAQRAHYPSDRVHHRENNAAIVGAKGRCAARPGPVPFTWTEKPREAWQKWSNWVNVCVNSGYHARQEGRHRDALAEMDFGKAFMKTTFDPDSARALTKRREHLRDLTVCDALEKHDGIERTEYHQWG
jgi:hypothetical protein